MNWDAFAAIGEWTAAIAVLLTLVYLARQVKEAKFAMYRQTSQDLNVLWNDIHNTVAATPELASALAKCEREEPLNEIEAIQARCHYMALINAVENNWTQVAAQDIPTQEVAELFNALMENPGFRTHWEQFYFITAKDFQNFTKENGT